jgi:molybdate/tungstate transport system permease protein
MSLRLQSSFSLIFALLGALLILFVVGPILRLLVHASPAALGQTFQDPEFAASITLTLVTATTATLLGAVVGVPLAYLLARKPFRGRGLVQAVIELPIVIPHPVAGIALLLFLGRHSAVGGTLANIGLEFVNHVPGIVAAMLFVSTPILVSGAREAFEAIDPRLERVARTLGDSPWSSFRRVSLPLAGRGIVASASLAWARSVSEFGAIVILTYNPKVTSVFIYDRFTGFGLQAAIAPAVVLLFIALIAFGLIRLLQPAVPR